MAEITSENPIKIWSYEEIVQLRNVISNKEIDSSFIDKTSKIDGKPASGYTIVVDDGIIPANPIGLTATAGIQFVFLQWTYNTETDMSHYEIWRNTTDNNATATKIAQTKANVFADESVTAGTVYFYWIKAVDHLGNISGFNATVGSSATPRNVISGDITNLAITELKLADGSVINAKITDLAVNNAKISDLHGGKITAGTITAGKINVINLAAINANLGTVTAGTVRGLLIETNAATTTGIKMDSTSLRGYDGAGVKTFELVRATGALTLKGSIESGSTITGSRFRTAVSGVRIEIDEVNHDLIFYNTGGIVKGNIDLISNILRITAENELHFLVGGGFPLTLSPTTIDMFETLSCEHIIPKGGFSIGSATNRFENLFMRTTGFIETGRLRLALRTTHPASPSEGEMIYRSDLKKLQFFNGTLWETITSS